VEIDRMLSYLRFELEQVNKLILTLERLATARGGRRIGRPPNWLRATAKQSVPYLRNVKSIPSEARKAVTDM
jgi:hypothetical protein